MIYMYDNLGHMYFHWMIIRVWTQTPTFFMYVDITGVPKL